MAEWRLITDGPADGAWNMAVDAALLATHEAGNGPPTVRLYGWDRPTVSIGRFQKAEDVDGAVCTDRGIGACRRPTGGRGVLHDDEVTYSIVAGVRDGLPRGVSASYRMLCGALVEAYRALGVQADLTSRPRGERGSGACYLHATDADLSLGAAKLSGSAQVWSHASCLQHGSFVLSRDVACEAAVFRLGSEEMREFARTTSTINDALGTPVDRGTVIRAVVAGLSSGLGAAFVSGALTSEEDRLAQEMVEGFRIDPEASMSR